MTSISTDHWWNGRCAPWKSDICWSCRENLKNTGCSPGAESDRGRIHVVEVINFDKGSKRKMRRIRWRHRNHQSGPAPARNTDDFRDGRSLGDISWLRGATDSPSSRSALNRPFRHNHRLRGKCYGLVGIRGIVDSRSRVGLDPAVSERGVDRIQTSYGDLQEPPLSEFRALN